MGVDRERDPHGIAVPARDLEHVRGPAPVRGGRRDLTVMGPLAATPGMARQQQARPLHHAVDTLVVHPRQTLGLGLTVQERGDPAVAVARPGVDQAPDARQQLGVAGLAIWGSRPAPASLRPLHQVRARDLQGVGDGLHREPSGSCDGQRNSGFFARAAASASFRISTSRVCDPRSERGSAPRAGAPWWRR